MESICRSRYLMGNVPQPSLRIAPYKYPNKIRTHPLPHSAACIKGRRLSYAKGSPRRRVWDALAWLSIYQCRSCHKWLPVDRFSRGDRFQCSACWNAFWLSWPVSGEYMSLDELRSKFLRKDKDRFTAFNRWRLFNPHYRMLKRRCLDLAANCCQSCHKNPRTGLDIHHLTYERIGRESLEDVQILCKKCHTKADAIRRAEEAKRGEMFARVGSGAL